MLNRIQSVTNNIVYNIANNSNNTVNNKHNTTNNKIKINNAQTIASNNEDF